MYDFFQDRFGRDSLDDEGFALHSRVRYCTSGTGCPYANAFWDGSQMTYGSGYASADDVVGHELAHGFTEFTSDLLYYYQSGAINESLSDVFGEYIDLTNGAGDDSSGVRWEVGEDLPIGAIRDMADPPSYGDPDRMTSPSYTGTTGDSGGVHTNSGVNNKAASSLVDGGTFNGRTVTGLGADKAARIYYEVATTFLTSGSDYADLGDALVQSCTNLIGQESISAGDCVEVGDAVAATEMGTVPPAAPVSDAPVCNADDPVDLFADDLDSGLGAWTITTPTGSTPWRPVTGYAHSGEVALQVPDTAAVVDTRIEQNADVLLPQGAFLHVAHAYDLESSFDGGVIEYSTDGGSTWSDVTVGGPSFTHNGYVSSLSTAFGNPIGGRQAFTGVSRGYLSSRVDLAALAGEDVRFWFRFGSDTSVADFGWFVDDVRIYTCGEPPDPVPGLSVTKSADQSLVVAGEVIDWHVAVQNTGEVPLTGVVVSDGAAPGCAGAAADVGATVTVDCSHVTSATDVPAFALVGSSGGIAMVDTDQTEAASSNAADVTVTIPAHSFNDVPAWVDGAVAWITFHGVVDGYTPQAYGPERQITRAEAVRMLWRLAFSPDVSHAHSFGDVPAWVDPAVDWADDPTGPAAPSPMIAGCGDNTFRPNDPITRGQLVRILWRFAGDSGSVCGAHGLTDVPAWIDPAVSWATCDVDGIGPLAPVVTGYADGSFRPDLPSSRAETTRMLQRLAAQLGL